MPLLSLIKDAVDICEGLDIPCLELTSNIIKKSQESKKKIQDVFDKKIKLVFCTPEGVTSKKSKLSWMIDKLYK